MTSTTFEESILIAAPVHAVWENLASTELAPQWMGDTEMAVQLETDWVVGESVVVRGFHHVSFENTGRVLAFEPARRLVYTHLSSLSRLPDEPSSYATLAFTLAPVDDGTSLLLVATGIPTEAVYRHLKFYWGVALECLKQQVERTPASPAGGGI